jgi:hypothetical protein
MGDEEDGATQMSQILQAKLSSVRRKHVVVALATGVSAALGVALLALAATMLLDYWLTLSFTWRAAFLAVNVALVVCTLLYAGLGPIVFGPDEDEMALMVEDAHPAFRTRLIASVQLSRPNAVPAGASTSLVRAMIAQAESIARPMDFAGVVKTDRLVRIGAITLLIVVLGLAGFAWGGEASRALLQRAFLADVPIPRATRVLHVTGDLLAARGDAIEILALADGVVPSSDDRQKLYIRTDAGRKTEYTLTRINLDAQKLDQIKQLLAYGTRDPRQTDAIRARLDSLKTDAPIFGVTIDNAQDSFAYTVRLNDGDSERPHKITVLPRPAVTKIQATQVFPAYTGLGAQPRQLGDLTILQGSRLQLSINTNKPLRRSAASPTDLPPNLVHLIGSNKDVPLTLAAGDGKQLTGDIDLPPGTTGFSIDLTDERGLRSKDPAVYRVDLVPDKAPTVRILVPTRKEVLLVREAKHRLVFEAADDYAIGKVTLKYKVDDGAEQGFPLDLKGQTPKSFTGEHPWQIAQVQPPSATRPVLEGSVIEYWIEVEDTRSLPGVANGGPNKGASEHYMIRVGTKEEVRAQLAARLADIGSGLRSATEDQEGLAGRVQTLLLERQEPATTQPVPDRR